MGGKLVDKSAEAAVGIQGLSGAYGVYQANEQAQILRQNAAIAEQNIPLIRQRALEHARQLQIGKYLITGKQKAGYGKSGLAQGGSVLDLIDETTANFDRDTSFALLEGELQARGQQRQAELSRFQARTLVPQALTGGVLNTAAMYARSKMPALGYTQYAPQTTGLV